MGNKCETWSNYVKCKFFWLEVLLATRIGLHLVYNWSTNRIHLVYTWSTCHQDLKWHHFSLFDHFAGFVSMFSTIFFLFRHSLWSPCCHSKVKETMQKHTKHNKHEPINSEHRLKTYWHMSATTVKHHETWTNAGLVGRQCLDNNISSTLGSQLVYTWSTLCLHLV